MVKALLFDLDGTLLDTVGGICDASNSVLTRYGRKPVTKEMTVHFIGNGAKEQLRRAWQGEVSEELLAQALSEYRPYYAAHLEPAPPYEGIPELLREWKERGGKIAVVTNKPAESAEILAERHLPGLADAVIGEKPGVPVKPAADMAFLAMQALKVLPEECLFIGDGETDVQTARAAGMPCISCTWGYRSTAELLANGADILADSVAELRRFIYVGAPAARYLTLLKRRRSIRRFASRPVEKEKTETLLSGALLLPTSRDLNEVSFIAVTKRETIDALARCKAHGAEMLATAPLVLVLSAAEERADTWCEDSSLAAIALQLLAEELGLASCWVQIHMRKDASGGDAEKNVAQVLALPTGRRCVCMLAIGYRDEEKEPRREPSRDDVRLVTIE